MATSQVPKSNAKTPRTSAWDRVIEPWWGKMGLGIVILGGTWLEYNDFTKLENGESKSMLVGASTKFLYDIGGKWLPVGISLAIALMLLAWAVYQLSRPRQ